MASIAVSLSPEAVMKITGSLASNLRMRSKTSNPEACGSMTSSSTTSGVSRCRASNPSAAVRAAHTRMSLVLKASWMK